MWPFTTKYPHSDAKLDELCRELAGLIPVQGPFTHRDVLGNRFNIRDNGAMIVLNCMILFAGRACIQGVHTEYSPDIIEVTGNAQKTFQLLRYPPWLSVIRNQTLITRHANIVNLAALSGEMQAFNNLLQGGKKLVRAGFSTPGVGYDK